MKNKIIIIIFIVIILIIPFFIFNETNTTKDKAITKNIKNKTDDSKENIKKEKFKYITIGHDNINNYIKEEQIEEERIIYVCED